MRSSRQIRGASPVMEHITNEPRERLLEAWRGDGRFYAPTDWALNLCAWIRGATGQIGDEPIKFC